MSADIAKDLKEQVDRLRSIADDNDRSYGIVRDALESTRQDLEATRRELTRVRGELAQMTVFRNNASDRLKWALDERDEGYAERDALERALTRCAPRARARRPAACAQTILRAEEGSREREYVMSHYWAQFSDRGAGCIEVDGSPYEAATKEKARAIAETLGTVTSVDVLPYPRTPHIGGERSQTPAFCFGDLRECLGRTACPRRRACDD